MIFPEYLRIFSTKNTPGGPTMCPRGRRVRPPPGHTPCLVHPTWVPSTYPCTHTLCLAPEKNHPPAQTRVLAHLAAIFDLLAQSSIRKTALGDCSSVCDSSNGPISFCSNALFIANFCCLGETILELECQMIMVPSSYNA